MFSFAELKRQGTILGTEISHPSYIYDRQYLIHD